MKFNLTAPAEKVKEAGDGVCLIFRCSFPIFFVTFIALPERDRRRAFSLCSRGSPARDMTPFIINISNLSPGTHSYALEGSPAEINLDEQFTRLIRVNADLDRITRGFALRGTALTAAHLSCDRCLGEFDLDLQTTFTLLYSVATTGAEEEEKDDLATVIAPEANIIDFGEDVRQEILLAVPRKLLCKEECRGLCPVCGRNLNNEQCSCKRETVDPRWAPLARLSAQK